MNIYHLISFNKSHHANNSYRSHVIIAQSESVARRMANDFSLNEGLIWEDSALVRCEMLGFATASAKRLGFIISEMVKE